MAASGRSPNYNLPYPLSTDVVDVSGDIELLTLKIDTDLEEIVQDIIGLMISSNTETGISVTYDDATEKLNFALDTGYLKDSVAPMLAHENHVGVTVTYDTENDLINMEVTGGGGGGGSVGSASLTDIWWLGV